MYSAIYNYLFAMSNNIPYSVTKLIQLTITINTDNL